jgi:hypothetical protein
MHTAVKCKVLNIRKQKKPILVENRLCVVTHTLSNHPSLTPPSPKMDEGKEVAKDDLIYQI